MKTCVLLRPPAFAERSAPSQGSDALVGYGAVFYDPRNPEQTQYMLEPGVAERLDPHAFDRTLRERPGVLGYFNHDSNLVLGRVPDTMRVWTDAAGLRYEINAGNSPTWQNIREAVARRDVRGSSFQFGNWTDEFHKEGDLIVRAITDLTLFEVGPVTFPAYTGTTAAIAGGAAPRSSRSTTPKMDDVIRRIRLAEAQQFDMEQANAPAQLDRAARLAAALAWDSNN